MRPKNVFIINLLEITLDSPVQLEIRWLLKYVLIFIKKYMQSIFRLKRLYLFEQVQSLKWSLPKMIPTNKSQTSYWKSSQII
jgi:hypothetical protein